MARCKFCKMDSPDLFWKNTELNENLPKKPKLFEIKNGVEIPHGCKPPPPEPPEKEILCIHCDPLKRKPMTISKLKHHIRNEHLIFYLSDEDE